MKKILVTGGAGFIGSHLVDKLVAEKYTVGVVDDLSGGKGNNVHKAATFFKADIRNFKKIDSIMAAFRPEIVFHLAANAAENKAQFSPVDITSRNYDGSIKVLTAAIRHGMKKFIFTSSIAVYGENQIPFKENTFPEPEDLYGISKLAFEHSLKILSKIHNFSYVITRPHNVYGPRQNMQDPYRNVVTIFMNSLLRDKPYYIYGDGEQRRCFSYIDDVIEAHMTCMKDNVSGMTFNIGSDKDYSLNQLSQIIFKVTDTRKSPMYLPNRPQEVALAISDHTLSKKYLNYKDRTSLEKGLKITWQWVKHQGYKNPKFTNVEIDSPLLPQNWRKTKKTVTSK